MAEHPVSVDLVLDDSACRACKGLSGSPLSRAFYLAGGTELAVHLKHRTSLDLDFFTMNPAERLDSALVSSSLVRLFPRQDLSLEMSQVDQSTWTVGSTKTSFIAYPFPLIDEPFDGNVIAGSLKGIHIASVRDIACMKAYALGRGATFRDYVDLFFILEETDITLHSLTVDCARKFVLGNEQLFSKRLFLEQLVYTEDILDRDASLKLLLDRESLAAEDVGRYLRRAVDQFVNQEIGDSGGELP